MVDRKTLVAEYLKLVKKADESHLNVPEDMYKVFMEFFKDNDELKEFVSDTFTSSQIIPIGNLGRIVMRFFTLGFWLGHQESSSASKAAEDVLKDLNIRTDSEDKE